MADISKIKLDNSTYDIKDSTARIISSYSNTEQVIGTWTTGKPLYRKLYNTFTFGTGATNNYIILDNATTYNIINGYGKVSIVNNSFTMILGTGDYGLGSLSNVYKNESSGDIYINTSLSQNDITSIEIILEYTKSTD